MNVLKFIFILLEVIILFNILIFVHELGHFLAARWRGLKIQRFAIWFGKPIWKRKYNGVEYALGTIPFGGYVSLPQMAPMDAIEGKPEETEEDGGAEESLPPISALDKIIVAFAGPLFSFLLAAAFAVVVWVVGRPVSEAETTTVVGYVKPGGPADQAGLKTGDQVLEISGKPVTKFSGMGPSVTWRIVSSVDDSIPVKVMRAGKVVELEAVPEKLETKAWERKSLRKIMIGPAYTSIVGKIVTNSPAALAGLQLLDHVTKLNGQTVYYPDMIDEYAKAHPEQALTLQVNRNGKSFEVTLKPEVPVSPPDEAPHLGILWENGGLLTLSHPGVWQQIYDSVDALVSTLGALFSSKSDIKPQHLSGAVKILNIYYILFESENGWRLALWFSVLLNVNLAILNMLPIPVLDGGHIVLALIEGISRRGVSVRFINLVQNSCAFLLIGYMLYITFYDVQDLPWRRSRGTVQELKFAPKPASPSPTPAQP